MCPQAPGEVGEIEILAKDSFQTQGPPAMPIPYSKRPVEPPDIGLGVDKSKAKPKEIKVRRAAAREEPGPEVKGPPPGAGKPQTKLKNEKRREKLKAKRLAALHESSNSSTTDREEEVYLLKAPAARIESRNEWRQAPTTTHAVPTSTPNKATGEWGSGWGDEATIAEGPGSSRFDAAAARQHQPPRTGAKPPEW